jgi:uncharacterized membrane protein YbhN (UPF0104 family)
VSKQRLKRFVPWLGLVAGAVAIYLVYVSVRHYSLAEIEQSITDLPIHRILLAGVFAALSYGALTFFDLLGVWYAGTTLPYPKVALASFVSLSIGHSIGLAPLGSGALRYRYYSSWGLDAEAIAKVILFSTVTVTLGQTAFAGIVLIVEPGPAAQYVHLDEALVRAIGGLCLAVNVLYVVLAAKLRQPLRFRSWSFKLPRWRLALAQVLVGVLNFGFLGLCLYEVLAEATNAPFSTIATIYVLANIAALISHVPGGLGVIEYIVMSLLSGADVFGAVLAYRTVYYLVPLAIGGALFFLTLFGTGRGRSVPSDDGAAAVECLEGQGGRRYISAHVQT